MSDIMRGKARTFERLLRRSDFVATSKGARASADAFGLQTRRRQIDCLEDPPRFGITVTKKTAPNAVDRNRIRRRLREALRLGASLSGAVGHDYVIVGRTPILSMPFNDLQAALAAGVSAVTNRSGRSRNSEQAQRRR